MPRALRRLIVLMTLLAIGGALAGCGPCGDFFPSGLGGSACHSDHAPQ